MGLSSCAVTVYCADSILASSHTLRTILKSEFLQLNKSFIMLMLHRVMIASIKNLGRCPCPRCRMPLARVDNLGTALDRQERTTLARVDNQTHRDRVAKARNLIYDKNYAVKSKAVEDLLDEDSSVPTAVSISDSVWYGRCLTRVIRMHSRESWGPSGSVSS